MSRQNLRPLMTTLRSGPARPGPETARTLLTRYPDGRDESAFAALVERHGPRVLAACRQVLDDPADIDDAFQATFLVLMNKARAMPWRA